tara:strand:- start:168 stop:785 length:618 start_codon:yes stop_codon:yes gene_type:complete
MRIALKESLIKKHWTEEIHLILEMISSSGEYKGGKMNCKVLWGDARQKLQTIPANLKFDLIFLDPFSPKKCPHLWSEEFLKKLIFKMAPGGRLITYSRAAAIRNSLRSGGLRLMSLIPAFIDNKNWSNGTLAILPDSKNNLLMKTNIYQPLSRMEEEHLSTKAAIPYRDLSGKDNPQQILIRRQKEQQISDLESTNNWKKRWRTI